MAARRVGFTGHQALESDTMAMVASAIRGALQDGRIVGVCSLAEGSDQLFAQTVIDGAGDLVVVIPCDGYETTFETAAALATFRSLKAHATELIELDFAEPSEEAYWAAGQRVVEESDQLLAVWDGKRAGGLGGTADVVAFARQIGKPVTVIWPAGAARL